MSCWTLLNNTSCWLHTLEMCSILELQTSKYQLWCYPNAAFISKSLNVNPCSKVLTFGLGDFIFKNMKRKAVSKMSPSWFKMMISQKSTQKSTTNRCKYNSQGDIELMGHWSQVTTTRGISPCNNLTIAAKCYKCTCRRLDRFHIIEFLNENTEDALGMFFPWSWVWCGEMVWSWEVPKLLSYWVLKLQNRYAILVAQLIKLSSWWSAKLWRC